MTCKDCIHYDMCNTLEIGNAIPKIPASACGCFKDQSRFMEIPCKIGDVVWVIRHCHNKTIAMCGLVGGMYFYDDMSLVVIVSHIARGKWGEKVFPTKEAAEKAIEERKLKPR